MLDSRQTWVSVFSRLVHAPRRIITELARLFRDFMPAADVAGAPVAASGVGVGVLIALSSAIESSLQRTHGPL